MTLDRLRPAVSGALAPSVGLAKRLGMTPNAVSVVAFAMAILGGGLFAAAPRREMPLLYLAGAVAVALNGWLDVVDGELARDLGTGGPAGDLLDHVLDRYADIVVVVGLAAGIERYGPGLAADRLALVIVGGAAAAFVTRSFGPLGLVGWLLVFFAVVGHFTALQRFYYAYRAL